MTFGTAKTLPFLPRFDAALLAGTKTATTRTRRYGDPGAILDTRVGPVVLKSVTRVTLREVRDKFWREEGLRHPEEFQAVWCAIHPRSQWQPEKKVWLHRFSLLNEEMAR